MKNLRKSLLIIFAALMAASLFFASCAKPYDDGEETVELTEQETNLAANNKEAADAANEKQNSIENTKEPVEYPLYFTRSAFWIGSGSSFVEDEKMPDTSNFCYFIVNSEDDITWVTYPQVEDEEYGEDYRERQEYKLTQMDNGLWNLSEEVSEADLYDSSNSSNLGMLGMMSDYVEGLELHFEDDTIFVDYKGYLQIKEWYTKVESEPQTQNIIFEY